TQRHLDALQTLPLKPFFLEVLTRKSLDHADRRQHFFYYRNYFALFTAQRARRFLDAACVSVDNDKQKRRDGKRDQCEAPVDEKHHHEHSDQRQYANHDAQQRLRNEILNRVDIGGDGADQVAGRFAIVVSERQALDVMIESPPQVV